MYEEYKISWVKVYDVVRDLVPFLQLKKREKHPWRSVTFSKRKAMLLRGCLTCFLNFTNGTKLRNALYISFLLTN